jgi:hypothetical protein
VIFFIHFGSLGILWVCLTNAFVFLLFTETLNGTNAVNSEKKKCRHHSAIIEKQCQNEREFVLSKNAPAMGQIQREEICLTNVWHL